ncbi:hypothetical protein T439DRAFT_326095 [Meredithblackwellia eburnea MCA 4105]
MENASVLIPWESDERVYAGTQTAPRRLSDIRKALTYKAQFDIFSYLASEKASFIPSTLVLGEEQRSTSAALITKNLESRTSGYFEASIEVPSTLEIHDLLQIYEKKMILWAEKADISRLEALKQMWAEYYYRQFPMTSEQEYTSQMPPELSRHLPSLNLLINSTPSSGDGGPSNISNSSSNFRVTHSVYTPKARRVWQRALVKQF